MGPGAIGQGIADAVRAASGAPVSALHRWDPAAGHLALQAVSGEEAAAFASIASSPAGHSIADLAVRSGCPVVTADLFEDARVPLSVEAKRLHAGVVHRAVFSAPLVFDDTVLGVLSVGHPVGVPLSGERIEALDMLRRQAAIAAYGAALCEEARRRQQEMVALDEIAREVASSLDRTEVFQRIIHRARELCGTDLAFVAPYDDKTGTLTVAGASGAARETLSALVVRHGRGAGGRVLESGEPFVTDDMTRDARLSRDPAELPPDLGARALAVVPLRFRTSITGLLWVANRAPRRFTDNDLRILDKLAEQAAVALEHSRLYAEAQELAVSRERMRVATELHDTLSQMLFSMALGLEWCLHRLAGASELRTKIQEIKRETGVMMKQLRELIYHLAPGQPRDGGFSDKLRRLVGQFREFTGIPVELVEQGDAAVLAPRQQDVLYKTFQEALANVAKHARATRANVRIDVRADELSFEVTDDGIGPPPEADLARLAREPGHFGLRQMLERIEALGGAVAFGRARPSGFRLWGTLPRDVR
jgi:signal transduction histidine kinase